jgi:hypothetical protein
VGFFLNSSVEEELDLFIQRPMLVFSASSAIGGIPPTAARNMGREKLHSWSREYL